MWGEGRGQKGTTDARAGKGRGHSRQGPQLTVPRGGGHVGLLIIQYSARCTGHISGECMGEEMNEGEGTSEIMSPEGGWEVPRGCDSSGSGAT